MTPPSITHSWTWTGDRTLPTWLDRHHHWHADRPVIHTTDGPRHLYDGWMVILWRDGAITVASATVAERVYGPNGIASRLTAAENALARIQAIADEHPAGIDTALIHEALDQSRPTETERDCLFRRDGCRPCNASDRCATCDPKEQPWPSDCSPRCRSAPASDSVPSTTSTRSPAGSSNAGRIGRQCGCGGPAECCEPCPA